MTYTVQVDDLHVLSSGLQAGIWSSRECKVNLVSIENRKIGPTVRILFVEGKQEKEVREIDGVRGG